MFFGSGGKGHFSQIRDLSRKELAEYLDKYAGTKALVWDEALTGPLGLISEYQFLKERQVTKMISLKSGRLPLMQDIENIVFVTRPKVSLMDKIADNVKGEEIGGSVRGPLEPRIEFHILFVPQKSLLCEMRLKDNGVFGSFTFLDELNISWFPLESDVISMENESLFADYHLNEDPTCLYGVAKAMIAIQSITGIIPRVYGKGRAAKQVFDFMTRIRKEMMGEEPVIVPTIDTLIIIDRQVDLLSPLATQLTYEGLIDEIYGIRHSAVKLPPDKFVSCDATGPPPTEPKKISLNSGDELFSEIRDKNFNAVGPALSRKAKSVSAQFDERHEAKSVRELKSFVERLPQMQIIKQSLAVHTSIAELIKEWTDNPKFLDTLQTEQQLMNFQNTDKYLEAIEDAVCQEVDLVRVLRLICMQSVVNSGLKPKVLEAYRKLILEGYGFEHFLTLLNLEKACGLLGPPPPQHGNRSNYAVLRKRLNLTLDDINEQKPTDIAYVHSVYAPISVRLVQYLSSPGGWRSIRDVLDLLPGPTLEENQFVTSVVKKIDLKQKRQQQTNESKTTLVLFIGGITFAEISALRFLSQQEDSSTEFLIATTSIINGNNFIWSLMNNIETN